MQVANIFYISLIVIGVGIHLVNSSKLNNLHLHHNQHVNNIKPQDGPTCEQIEDDQRFDCYPEYGANEDGCVQRGCCWRVPKFDKINFQNYGSKLNKKTRSFMLDVPYCYYPKGFPNYQVVSNKKYQDGQVYTLEKENQTFRPNEILKLQASVVYENAQRLRVQITDPNNDRYQVPVVKASPDTSQKFTPKDDTDFQVFINDSPFFIQVFRKSTGKLIFDTSVAPLIFADQYIEFSTSLTNGYFYGIGEHRDNLAHTATWKSFTLWNRDVSPTLNTNLYGTHPFYLSFEEDGNAFGFYLLNSNGMDVNVQPTPALTFITIGGILDFYIYMGPTPQDVIMQHTEVVGRSAFPQYWTLGFHLCRWRYDNSTKLREVIERNRAIGLPYDTQWTDIDGMNSKMDWTYDTANFSELPDIVKDLHAHGQHYVNIIDPAISNTRGYAPYETGLEMDVFIKPADSDEPLVGIVWPGQTVYPDFTHPNATKWWTNCAQSFHDLVEYDGIWIDMNEPSNFIDGSLNGCTKSSLDNPPYTPRVLGNQLSSRTVCPSARQYLSSHYNLHNMYGHFEAIATSSALTTISPNKRPFVLTRSSFGGTGQYSAHWSGDNRAQWDDLYYSIPNMLNFNMFGVSQVGSDICGFSGETNEELCVRWMQLGSFYPFMRNHNDDTSKDQDPAVFSYDAQEAMKKALNIRYTLLPYLYTLFYRSHVYGETVVRPLFFEFPLDTDTHLLDRQFMFGPAFLITPVLEPGATSVQGYFPQNETWYRYDNGQELDNAESATVLLDAPLDEINVHVRAGFIVPYQFPEVTTTQSRKNPFGLLVALKRENVPSKADSVFAAGTLFWDDGESSDSIEDEKFNLFNFIAKDGNLVIDRVQSGYDTKMILSDIKIYGLSERPSTVTINDDPADSFVYDDSHNTLHIKYFAIDMNNHDSISVSWS